MSLMQKNDSANSSPEKRIGVNVMKAAPKVSVIIPAFEIANYISETLDSVLAQTFRDYEIILINDGSPDTEEFEKVLEPYLNDIVYLKQERQGPGKARNTGIEHSRGELLAFLDGDDIWLSDYLRSQVNFLEDKGYDMVYSDAYLFGEPAFDGQTFMETSPSNGEVTVDSLLAFRCNVILSGTVARKQDVVDVGMFGMHYRAQDFNLWLRMSNNGSRIGYQKKALLKYRVRRGGVSGDSIHRVQRELDAFDQISAIIDFNPAQKNIIRRQKVRLLADLDIEKGKSLLLQGNFAEARSAFEKANEYRKSSYLSLIIGFMRIAPRLLLRIFRSLRKDEIVFIRAEREAQND